jgi:hypothetical protein
VIIPRSPVFIEAEKKSPSFTRAKTIQRISSPGVWRFAKAKKNTLILSNRFYTRLVPSFQPIASAHRIVKTEERKLEMTLEETVQKILVLPKIVISQAPEDVARFDASQFSAIINVSDTPCISFDVKIPSFWFPIHETGHWGYSPFYGAAKVIQRHAPFTGTNAVYVHCHAGANRAPSVVYAVMRGIYDAEDEIIDGLFPLYDGISKIYHRNVSRGHVFKDTISMLRESLKHPTYSIHGLLHKMISPNLFVR